MEKWWKLEKLKFKLKSQQWMLLPVQKISNVWQLELHDGDGNSLDGITYVSNTPLFRYDIFMWSIDYFWSFPFDHVGRKRLMNRMITLWISLFICWECLSLSTRLKARLFASRNLQQASNWMAASWKSNNIF